jgi:hypothetical protein
LQTATFSFDCLQILLFFYLLICKVE